MYIIFDENNREQLRYFLDELPEDLKDTKHIKLKSENEIPKKEGYTERAKLVDGELVWEYEKIEDDIEYISKENDKLKLELANSNMQNALLVNELSNLIDVKIANVTMETAMLLSQLKGGEL